MPGTMSGSASNVFGFRAGTRKRKGLTKLTDEIAQASSNRQRVCGLPSTVRSYYCNHVANTNQNLPAKYPTPRLLHMYTTCAQPPAFGRAHTDLNFRQLLGLPKFGSVRFIPLWERTSNWT